MRPSVRPSVLAIIAGAYTSAATNTQKKNRVIAGLAYWFPHPGGSATAALLLDYEQVTFPNFPAAAANAKQQRLALHGLINF